MPDNFNRNNSGGVMFPRQKRTSSGPDFGGDFTINGDLLDYVLMKAERGEEVKLEISAWRKEGRNNTSFLSLSLNTPYAERQGQQPERQYERQQERGMSERRYGEDKRDNGRVVQNRPQPRRELPSDDIPFGGSYAQRPRRPLDD